MTDSTFDNRAQVLLIDDDPHLRQALSQTLDLAGLKVCSLASAKGLAVDTAQKPQARVQRSPAIMKVAVPLLQHSQ